MVGLRSGGTSLLFPWVGGSALRCHPDRSNPIFSSHLTSREMVGLRSGGTSLLFPWVGGSALPCHPDRSNPIFSSHLTSCEMGRKNWVGSVVMRSGEHTCELPSPHHLVCRL